MKNKDGSINTEEIELKNKIYIFQYSELNYLYSGQSQWPLLT